MRDDAFFWDGAREGKLLLRACAQCDRVAHPPVPMCPNCHSLEWSTRQMSGRGTVHAWLESKHPSRPDDAPRIVVVVDLEEGQRLVSNLVGTPLDEVVQDMPVEVIFEPAGDYVLPKFRAAGAAQ